MRASATIRAASRRASSMSAAARSPRALDRGPLLDVGVLEQPGRLRLGRPAPALALAELLLDLSRGASAAALAEPLADELQMAVDLVRVVAATHPPEGALHDEQRAGVAACGHPSGVRRSREDSCAARAATAPPARDSPRSRR